MRHEYICMNKLHDPRIAISRVTPIVLYNQGACCGCLCVGYYVLLCSTDLYASLVPTLAGLTSVYDNLRLQSFILSDEVLVPAL